MDESTARDDVARYEQLTEGGAAVDAQTWGDMLLGQYSARLGRGVSLAGRQQLHTRLRRGGDSWRIRALHTDPAAQASLSAALRRMEEAEAEVDVCAPLFGPPEPVPPAWTQFLWLVPLAFLLSCVVCFAWWQLWPVPLALSLLLMGLQVAYHSRVQTWEAVSKSLHTLLGVHATLGAQPSPLLPGWADGAAKAGPLSRKLARSAVALVPGVSEYADWLMLDNVKHYFSTRRLVGQHRAFLADSYTLVANLEADLALVRHLGEAPRFCWTVQGDNSTFMLDGVIHPLLDEALPLNVDLEQKGAFITGQNGIGKSTLLRTIGINLVAARAFGFCYAVEACVPVLPVCSSMRSEDAMDAGESLYVAELRRAQEMLALAKGPQRMLFIVDEIFRGTNHLESVSAAAAVLEALAHADRVIVSSHNLVLGPLLANCLAPFCVQAETDGLSLVPGTLRDTNGLALLAQRGFDPAIEARAQKVYLWLQDFMNQPAGENPMQALVSDPTGQTPV